MDIRQIDDEIEDLNGIKTLVQTYEEIAATRMQKIKSSVLNTRNFLESLFEIYQHVKFSHDKMIQKLEKKKQEKKEAGEEKAVAVLLTANTGLYGDIIQETYNLFKGNFDGEKTDLAVIGDVGRKLVERDKETLDLNDYKFFDIPDGTSDPSDFSSLISFIVQYDSVDVYHGKFESLLNQVPIKQNVTGDLPESEKKAIEEAQYIFEPSIESIVGYFESEIMASVFEQSILESSLSKYASRMINLDRAVVNIRERINKTEFKRQRVRHRNMNKRQLDLLSSMSLWN